MPDPDNRKGVNAFSLCIELVGMYGQPYTSHQYEALNWLHRNYIVRKHPVIKYVGHDQIAGNRAVKLGIRTEAKKKVDPGSTFDWGKFQANHFIGNPLAV